MSTLQPLLLLVHSIVLAWMTFLLMGSDKRLTALYRLMLKELWRLRSLNDRNNSTERAAADDDAGKSM